MPVSPSPDPSPVRLPKSASFRLIDIVGVDIWVHVLRNLYEAVPNDPARELYRIPQVMEQMMERGWLGEKRGQGFYKRIKGQGDGEILTLDPQTMDYRPRQKARFASLEAAKGIEGTRERLRALIGPLLQGQKGDKAQQFLWGALSETALYAMRRIP